MQKSSDDEMFHDAPMTTQNEKLNLEEKNEEQENHDFTEFTH